MREVEHRRHLVHQMGIPQRLNLSVPVFGAAKRIEDFLGLQKIVCLLLDPDHRCGFIYGRLLGEIERCHRGANQHEGENQPLTFENNGKIVEQLSGSLIRLGVIFLVLVLEQTRGLEFVRRR